MGRFSRNLRYVAEAVILFIWFIVFRLLPLDIASSFAGLIGRILGPLIRAHHTASDNIKMVMPEVGERERKRILNNMWDNMGRVMGEYPHLSRKIMKQRITIEGLEHLQEARYSGKGALFVSGHFANWEIAPLIASFHGLPLVLIYRAANNPFADWLICHIRSYYNSAMYSKGREGAMQALKALKSGQAVGMLIDQKMNDGEALQFFGYEAMTATAATSMAIKLQVPLLAARVVRTDGAYFHVTIQPPVYYDEKSVPAEAMTELNTLFENWIREHPAQWFWVHRRWGK